MKFKDLTDADQAIFIKIYNNSERSQDSKQKSLASLFDVNQRTIRKWANRMELGLMEENIVNPAKILIYDIETSRATFKRFWTGKQYIGHYDMIEEPKIISIAWKWLGSDEVEFLTWDKEHDDKKMIVKFLEVYNDADLVIGQNNDRFDNRWVNAVGLRHDVHVNVYVKSFDIQKQAKRLFRLPSYSMAYVAKFLGVTLKQSHEGILMWKMVEDGTLSQQQEYLGKMIEYNVGDVITTEEMYLKMRKYMGHKIHVGVLDGKSKYSCPNCGSENIDLYKTTTTGVGTIQRVMICDDCRVQFKVSNTEYLKNNQ